MTGGRDSSGPENEPAGDSSESGASEGTGSREQEGQEVILTVKLTIRRVLSRQEVKKAVAGLQSSQWTIREVAEAMGEREYRVRAAVSWLCHHGRATIVGQQHKMSSAGRPYSVAIYELREKKSPPDIGGLYRAFGLKG